MTITALRKQIGRTDGYRALLPVMPTLRESLGDHRHLWADEDAWLSETERMLDDHRVTLVEDPTLDLAVVSSPQDHEPHEMAVHNRTNCLRVLTMRGRHISLRYRYETWVLYQSRKLQPRVDLRGLAEQLTELEPAGVAWRADAVDDLTPQLAPVGDAGSDLDAECVETAVRSWLTAADDTWSPYDSEP